ncbi:MAG TPA: TetR/AcrR family transcriptional regulator [Solimonas sp.]|nr:TetR/AcrR family transcriptional regulator [Solimonas sp.]
MGTKERRQRELEDRERVFLECARDLIRDEGLLNLQMSRIAEKSEYAVGTLYKHFASKEDLLLALTVVDAEQHVDLFRRAAQWQASTRDRMFAISVADMIFVRRNPEHFRLAQYVLTEVVWRAASAERREDFLACSEPIGKVVVGIVHDAVAAGDLELKGLSPEEICTGLWTLATGTHNLVHAEGVLDDFNVREPYRLMCRHTQVMLNGYGWLPLIDTGDSESLDALIQRICKEVFDDLCN